MPEPRISVLIVAKNEGHNLAECLATARWADERVVVVDAASHDDTLAIAGRDAEVVAVRTFDDFASQRNTALALATGDWVCSIDADERFTPALAAEIRRAISDPTTPFRGFRVPIRSVILGRPFTFSGTQHDLPLRLFRRDCGYWVGLVHETVDLHGEAGTLENFLRHHSLPDVHVFLRKVDEYTTLEARGMSASARRYRPSDLALRPIWTFLKLYVAKQGFRDGAEGFMFCALSGVSVAIRAWKLRELQGVAQSRSVSAAGIPARRDPTITPWSVSAAGIPARRDPTITPSVSSNGAGTVGRAQWGGPPCPPTSPADVASRSPAESSPSRTAHLARRAS
jgi:hypothetical protein